MKLPPVLFASALLVLGIAPVSAHDEIRVIGTITELERSALEVKTKDGQIVSIKLDNGTFISRDRKKAGILRAEGRQQCCDRRVG